MKFTNWTIQRKLMMLTALLVLVSGQALAQAQAEPPATPPQSWGPVSINMEDVAYPYPVQFLARRLFDQDVRIAYMDVAPAQRGNGRTVVLLHGASYSGWYWADTIEALSEAGFRVIAVDRLGWGRSSKPIIPYSASLHASNIKAILDKLGIESVDIVGHSMGGRLASHFAHIYPDNTTSLVMVNPIGLGAQSRGRQFREPDAGELEPDLQQVYANIVRVERSRMVNWQPQFMENVRIRYGQAMSGEYPRLNLVRSLNNTVLSEPIDAYFPQLHLPALLLSGAQDGPDFPAAARRAVDLLPEGKLQLFDNAGHNPHQEIPEQFNAALIAFLTALES